MGSEASEKEGDDLLLGFVYFIADHDGDLVKIGYTGNMLAWRLGTLQQGMPYNLQPVAYLRGTRQSEGMLHAKFSHLRHQYEWFYFDKEIKSFINDCATTWPKARQPTPMRLSPEEMGRFHDEMEDWLDEWECGHKRTTPFHSSRDVSPLPQMGTPDKDDSESSVATPQGVFGYTEDGEEILDSESETPFCSEAEMLWWTLNDGSPNPGTLYWNKHTGKAERRHTGPWPCGLKASHFCMSQERFDQLVAAKNSP
jgi:T5orf172 domain